MHVVKAANGESDFADGALAPEEHAYFHPGEMFGSINFGPATKVQLVSGPANVTLPFHASLGYEMFLTIQGGSTVILPDGRERAVGPGTLVVMEDMGSRHGHAGRTGPCGYVSLQIVATTPLAQGAAR
ncbi:hypothetical protein [Sphingomonas sp.]|uniref:hypothetical protein n=1 Tax=Sphingomonas sp. TaxID=28214 RepID=UPI003CC5583A